MPAVDHVVVERQHHQRGIGHDAAELARVERPVLHRLPDPKLPEPRHYLAVALDYIEEGQQMDPEFLESIRGYATLFDIGDGETKALSLRVVKHP